MVIAYPRSSITGGKQVGKKLRGCRGRQLAVQAGNEGGRGRGRQAMSQVGDGIGRQVMRQAVR